MRASCVRGERVTRGNVAPAPRAPTYPGAMSEAQQERYQVRFDHGEAGAARIAPGAHVVVVADELDGHGAVARDDLARRVAAVADPDALVLVVGAAGAGDAARRVLDRQAERGDRAVVAVVAAGSVDPDGHRPAVEDQLAAGAVVDALAALGIDFSSPEAALVCAAAVSLRRATGHLLTASVSAGALTEAGGPEAVAPARPDVPVVEVRAPVVATA